MSSTPDTQMQWNLNTSCLPSGVSTVCCLHEKHICRALMSERAHVLHIMHRVLLGPGNAPCFLTAEGAQEGYV